MTDFAEFGRIEEAGWTEPDTASAYADGFAETADQYVPAMVAAVGAGSGKAALDICCGQGIVADGLKNAGATVSGLDFSPAFLALARERVAGVTFIEGNAMDLPMEDESFDAVTIGFGILHVPDQPRALAEARMVLRPGGRIALSTWHAPDLSPAFRIVFGAIDEHGDPSIVLPPGPALPARRQLRRDPRRRYRKSPRRIWRGRALAAAHSGSDRFGDGLSTRPRRNPARPTGPRGGSLHAGFDGSGSESRLPLFGVHEPAFLVDLAAGELEEHRKLAAPIFSSASRNAGLPFRTSACPSIEDHVIDIVGNQRVPVAPANRFPPPLDDVGVAGDVIDACNLRV